METPERSDPLDEKLAPLDPARVAFVATAATTVPLAGLRSTRLPWPSSVRSRPLRVSTAPTAPPASVARAPVAWTDETYRTLARQLQHDNAGRAITVKITVIGRPGAAVEHCQAVALALTSEKVPDLPKGLPTPPAGTRYTVFVAHKQWAKVAEALAADPEDAAIIEGYAALDPRVDGIAVYATSVTTKRLQAAKRAVQVPGSNA